MPPGESHRIAKSTVAKLREAIDELEISEDMRIRTNVKTIVKIVSVTLVIVGSYFHALSRIDNVRSLVLEHEKYNWTLFMQRDDHSWMRLHNTNIQVPNADDIYWLNRKPSVDGPSSHSVN